MGHDVFISYARQDGRAFAERLDGALQSLGYRTWRDLRDIDASRDFTAELESAIAGSRRVLVCVTAGTKRPDGFVRREIGYAQALGKPILVATVDGTVPPISIVNLTPARFDQASFADGVRELKRMLDGVPAARDASRDPFEKYLHELYRRIVGFLSQTVLTSVDLTMEEARGAVAPAGRRSFDMLAPLFTGHGWREDDSPARTFASFRDAWREYDGRLLMLGDPGSGKTVTLMTHARDAVAARLEDPTQPVPLVGLASTWDPGRFASLAQWLAEGYDELDASTLQTLIDRGDATLLLDGIDELPSRDYLVAASRAPGSQAPANLVDPRRELFSALPTRCGVVASCRWSDYQDLQIAVALNGAVTLQPLTEEQLASVLKQAPELLAAARDDGELREMLATPLVVNLFLRAYAEVSEADRRELAELSANPGELRDTIVRRYLGERYRWEERRLARQGRRPLFSFEEVQDWLGRLAMENAGTFRKSHDWGAARSRISANVLLAADFEVAMGRRSREAVAFQALARTLQLLVARRDGTHGFPHLLIRDALAFEYGKAHLLDPDLYGHFDEYANPAEAIGRTGGKRATAPLVAMLERTDISETMRECAASGLGYTRDPDAVEPLIAAMKSRRSIDRAAHSLGRLKDTRAFEPLVETLRRGSKYARRGAAVGLGWLEDSGATGPLIEQLRKYASEDQDDAFFLVEIVRALVQLGSTGRGALLAEIDHQLVQDSFVPWTGARHLLAAGDDRGLSLLLDRLANAAPVARGNAADALGLLARFRMVHASAVGPLVRALDDTDAANSWGVENDRVCDRALKALRAMDTAEATAAVAAWEHRQRS